MEEVEVWEFSSLDF
jgi:hypothetical protein